ncbi:MAG: hypothetical protein ACM336_09615 [Acidobacteriota bacterium]
MAAADVQTDFGSWGVDGHAIRIEYAVPVLEQICADAVDGLFRFRHGGIEIGGVLFGEAEGDRVRILAYRPLECEHAFGPRFVLSERDRAAFKDLLYAGRTDPSLRDMAPVGWYHSHTRSAIELSPRDVEIYDSFLPQRWQVALVIRPDYYGPARAGFFFRERDNTVQTAETRQEFVIRPRRHKAAAEPEPESEPESGTATEPPASELEATPAPEPEPEPPAVEAAPPAPGPWVLDRESPAAAEAQPDGEPALPAFANQATKARRKWLWSAVALALIASAGFGVERYYALTAPQQPLSLWVADMGGQLLIEWDRTARPIREASSGTLEITDGKDRVDIEIEGARLREGSVDYVRRAEIVDVRLRVHTRSRDAEESIRFVGQPVRRPPSPEEAEIRKQNEALKAEVADLRAQLEQLRRARARAAADRPAVPAR